MPLGMSKPSPGSRWSTRPAIGEPHLALRDDRVCVERMRVVADDLVRLPAALDDFGAAGSERLGTEAVWVE